MFGLPNNMRQKRTTHMKHLDALELPLLPIDAITKNQQITIAKQLDLLNHYRKQHARDGCVENARCAYCRNYDELAGK